MATFSGGIETDETGALGLKFSMSEDRAQDIFVMLLETASKVTETNPDTGETIQRARKLGECLTDELSACINRIEARAIAHKKAKAAKAAVEEVTDVPEVVIVAPSP